MASLSRYKHLAQFSQTFALLWRKSSYRFYQSVNLSSPHLWYGNARKLKRKIICHIGPTNSGKTFEALKRLKESSNGLYLGPLRLLAWEVSETLRQENVKCNLLTGNERDYFPCGGTHTSSTIEMVDFQNAYDVAVIDEIQLIGDSQRGWAWTQAFLGLTCNEIHLCGSATAMSIIQQLVNMTGDSLEIRKYERLSSLTVADSAIGSYKAIERGDCVVGFSRKMLYEIKKTIELKNPHLRCCVIYGSLPPEARKAQATLFNNSDTSGYDVLVASNAIGMGLNLSIKRIIFSTVMKFDGVKKRLITVSEMKQIAGRAGRYGSKYEEGLVTCLKQDDYDYVKSTTCLTKKEKFISRAGLFPTLAQIQLMNVLIRYDIDEDLLEAFWNQYFIQKWRSNTLYDDDDDVNEDVLVDLEKYTVNNNYHKKMTMKSKTIHSTHSTPNTNQYPNNNHNNNTSTLVKKSHDERMIDQLVMDGLSLSISMIQEHFGSIALFAEQIEKFIHINSDDDDDDDDDDIVMTSHSKHDKKYQHHHKNNNNNKKKQNNNKHKKKNYEHAKQLSKVKKNYKNSQSLLYLLETFRQQAELDENGLYFICNIDSTLVLAKLLDELNDDDDDDDDDERKKNQQYGGRNSYRNNNNNNHHHHHRSIQPSNNDNHHHNDHNNDNHDDKGNHHHKNRRNQLNKKHSHHHNDHNDNDNHDDDYHSNIISHTGHFMSLEHKYLWSMAPVDSDCDEALYYFREFARAFTTPFQSTATTTTTAAINNDDDDGKVNDGSIKSSNSNSNRSSNTAVDEMYRNSKHIRDSKKKKNKMIIQIHHHHHDDDKNDDDDDDDDEEEEEEEGYRMNSNHADLSNHTITDDTLLEIPPVTTPPFCSGTGPVRLRVHFHYPHNFIPSTAQAILQLEILHKTFDLYIWLYYRFPKNFVDFELAVQQRKLCTALIERGLSHLGLKNRDKFILKNDDDDDDDDEVEEVEEVEVKEKENDSSRVRQGMKHQHSRRRGRGRFSFHNNYSNNNSNQTVFNQTNDREDDDDDDDDYVNDDDDDDNRIAAYRNRRMIPSTHLTTTTSSTSTSTNDNHNEGSIISTPNTTSIPTGNNNDDDDDDDDDGDDTMNDHEVETKKNKKKKTGGKGYQLNIRATHTRTV